MQEVVCMEEISIQFKENDFILDKIDSTINMGFVTSREEFIKMAIRELIQKCEFEALTKRMETFARENTIKYPEPDNLSAIIRVIRSEEDERL